MLLAVTGLSALACTAQHAQEARCRIVVDPVDDTYRRQMNRPLTVQKSRHGSPRMCATASAALSRRTRTARPARSVWS